MILGRFFDALNRRWRKPLRAIILGAGSAEYGLYRKLEREKNYRVLFFIDEEPWNHRTKIGNAQFRYPAELSALCKNHDIDAVFYCDDDKADGLSDIPCEVIRLNA